eukprot:s7909_g1.t1
MFAVSFPYCYEDAAETAALLAIQVVVCGCYGALTLMAVFGIISWQAEQIIITFFDVLAKILISAYASVEERVSCVQLLATRLVAANIAEDVRRMVRHAGVPVFSVGRDLRITEWNMMLACDVDEKKMQEISGLSREDAISMYLADALKVEDSEWWQSGGRCQRNPVGDITGVLCMGQDVSKVRAARNTAQALAESCRDDAKGGYRIVWWNSWMVEKTGVSVERITGQHLRLLAQSSSWEPILTEVLNRKGPEAQAQSFELRLSDLHQCPTILQLTATPASTVMDEG